MENFHNTLENCEKCKSLAQQIFPFSWYFIHDFYFLNVLLDCTESFNTVYCISVYAETCRRVRFRY